MEVDENFCALVVALSTSRILLRSQETRRDTLQTSSSRGETARRATFKDRACEVVRTSVVANRNRLFFRRRILCHTQQS